MALISAIPDDTSFKWNPEVGSLRLALGRFSLPDLAIQLNRVGQQLERMPAAKGELLGLPIGTHSMRWAVAECFRLATMWSTTPSNIDISVPKASDTDLIRIIRQSMHLACSIMRVDGDTLDQRGIYDFVFPIIAPQFKSAHTSPLRAGQALWMFDEAITRRQSQDSKFPGDQLRKSFETTLGMPVREFVWLTLLTFGHSVGTNPCLNLSTWSQSCFYEQFGLGAVTNSGLIRPRLNDLFRVLGAAPIDLANWSKNQLRNESKQPSELDLLCTPNPLSEFPLVHPLRNDKSTAIAPVPYLLLEWLYEPLARRLRDNLPKELNNSFDLLFEEYVGMVLDRYRSGGGKWIPAFDINTETGKPGERESVVDFVRAFDRDIVMVDAKLARVWPIARHRLDPSDWESTHKHIRKAIRQAKSTWRLIREGRVSGISSSQKKNPMLLVVTHGDVALMGFDTQFWNETLDLVSHEFPGLQVTVASIDELHWLATQWICNSDQWFIGTLKAWREHKSQHLASRVADATGPLFSSMYEVMPRVGLAAAAHIERPRERRHEV